MTDQNAPRSLNRSLKEKQILMIALGSIIGAGLFVGLAPAVNQAGPLVLVSILVATVFCVIFSRALCDVTLSDPTKDGSFITRLGDLLGRKVFFLSGWLYWLVWMGVLTSQITAAGAWIHHLYPSVPVFAGGVAILGALTLVNIFSVGTFGGFAYWFAMVKLLAIVLFVGLAVIGLGHMGYLHLPFDAFAYNFGSHLVPEKGGWWTILSVMPTVFFMMAGSEVVSVAAGEADAPLDKVANLSVKIAISVGVIYVVCALGILAYVPWTEIDPLVSPFLPALHVMGYPYAENIVGLVIFVAILSALNASLYFTSRLTMEMAGNRFAPRWLGHLSKSGSPRYGVLFAAFCGTLIVATSYWFGAGLLGILLSLTGVSVIFLYLLILIASFRAGAPSNGYYFAMRILTGLFFVSVPVSMLFSHQARGQALLTLGAIAFLWICSFFVVKKRVN